LSALSAVTPSVTAFNFCVSGYMASKGQDVMEQILHLVSIDSRLNVTRSGIFPLTILSRCPSS
jgi:hypothetical protein